LKKQKNNCLIQKEEEDQFLIKNTANNLLQLQKQQKLMQSQTSGVASVGNKNSEGLILYIDTYSVIRSLLI